MVSEELLEQCEQILGYRFNNHQLLKESLTHASIAEKRQESNERLEFLGDAVLGLVVCHRLYELFPDSLEGDMTKLKSAVVSRTTCAAVANSLGLTDLIRVGKGMISRSERPSSMAAGVYESITAAIYLDGGYEAARNFILKQMDPWIQEFAATTHQQNFKSLLQQYAQKSLNGSPLYELLDEKGPDHSKCFEVRVVIGSRPFASAWGPTKKQAEQLAPPNLPWKNSACLPRKAPSPSPPTPCPKKPTTDRPRRRPLAPRGHSAQRGHPCPLVPPQHRVANPHPYALFPFVPPRSPSRAAFSMERGHPCPLVPRGKSTFRNGLSGPVRISRELHD